MVEFMFTLLGVILLFLVPGGQKQLSVRCLPQELRNQAILVWQRFEQLAGPSPCCLRAVRKGLTRGQPFRVGPYCASLKILQNLDLSTHPTS